MSNASFMGGSYQKTELHRGTLWVRFQQLSVVGAGEKGYRAETIVKGSHAQASTTSGACQLTWNPRAPGQTQSYNLSEHVSAKLQLPLISTYHRKTLAFSLKKMRCRVQVYIRVRIRRSDSQRSLNFTWNLGRKLRGRRREKGCLRSSDPRSFGTESQRGQKKVHLYMGQGSLKL